VTDLTWVGPSLRPLRRLGAGGLRGSRGSGLARRWLPLGPAFVAAVAYVDPGNVATNVTAGARHGYLLCWVVVAASGTAMLVQYLSAKLGLATGRTLPQHCRSRWSRRTALALWVQAEGVSLATELAEVLGGAIALRLLFGLALPYGALVTAAGSMVVLLLQRRARQGRFEATVTVLLGVCAAGFVVNALRAGPDAGAIAASMVPRLQGSESLLLAAGILGATVMPHAVYLHSALVCDRFDLDDRPTTTVETARRQRLLQCTRTDIGLALSFAAVVNLSLVVLAAAALPGAGADTIEGAQRAVGAVLGPASATLFALGLLASGLASSSVGAYAGAVVLEGFAGRRVPTVLRRTLTLLPALAVIASGVEPTRALVLSQVVLSLGLPFALWPLLTMTRDRTVMGPFVNTRLTTALAAVAAAAITGLGVLLLALGLG
jgi:manganese transport protein